MSRRRHGTPRTRLPGREYLGQRVYQLVACSLFLSVLGLPPAKRSVGEKQ